MILLYIPHKGFDWIGTDHKLFVVGQVHSCEIFLEFGWKNDSKLLMGYWGIA